MVPQITAMALGLGAVLAQSMWRLIREGFIVGASNPKSIVFFVAVLPQFVEYSNGSIPLPRTQPAGSQSTCESES